ncbi:FliA/WhiG family RNA polymerase sigma factor [Oceanobacillus halotolerans]|uniref:FliA/WhiG family RNA polymerase sigma factor n=1 Tax=Oceanobacillus halotolerans TaxID=2663380 RepID=UPI0013DA86B1|nr:FliA/WhiG family RNA polymerase sigma factor [Oceanobacillus halotolerans]
MQPTTSPLEQTLWEKWIQYQDMEAANGLIEHYMYLVHFHVERIGIHLPRNVNKDDLHSFGLLGLYDALKKFDISRDLKFDTYASFRIRGAIMDGLRKEDWLPRSTRDKTKRVEQAIEQLEKSNHRSPTAKEIGEYLDLQVNEVESILKDSLFANILSIEEKPKDNYDDFKEGVGYMVADETNQTPEERVQQVELETELVEGIKSLNENEQMVISLFYNEELTLTEIGQVLNLTTSRISQIHKKAIVKLRETLNKLSP